MASSAEQFLFEVEAFLADTGTPPTVFGRQALKDPRFVFDIRAGRSPSLKTIDRVHEYMETSAGEKAA